MSHDPKHRGLCPVCGRQRVARRGACWSCYRKHRDAGLEIPGTSPDAAQNAQLIRRVHERLPSLAPSDAWTVGAILEWAMRRAATHPVQFQRVMLTVVELASVT